MSRSFELVGLDGANPLGFLASLGVLVLSTQKDGRGVRLRWVRRHTWVPELESVSAASESHLARLLADALRGRPTSEDAQRELQAARKAMEAAKTAVKKKRQDLKQRRVARSERAEVQERELRPLEEELRTRRAEYLEALRAAVPRSELALGKRVEDATAEEYRELVDGVVARSDPATRDELDLFAALASDACVERGRLQPTPFEFTRGSGHQSFLEDVRKLMGYVTEERVHRCLFQPWDYRDEGLSLRWDPVEDRRYALMDRDPSGEGTRTVWMANLLAYRALVLYPAAPSGGVLLCPGWCRDDERWTFTWPIWEAPLGLDTVRSLLLLPELVSRPPDSRGLGARGIVAVYRAERIEVGSGANVKVNFAPARQVAAPAPVAASVMIGAAGGPGG